MKGVSESPLASANVSIALIHYPVYDKNRAVVATAVTNLDLHDIARTARTFGLDRYYVVTPIPAQRALAERIGRHWREGWGATYNPKRKAALEIMAVVPSLEDALADMESRSGRRPKIVVTGARGLPNGVSCYEMSELLADPRQPYLLLFGTGWGLTEEIFDRADFVLAPIKGAGEYNHLSVRSAAAIILDRLFGQR